MDHKERYKKLRLLIRKLNRNQKQQAKKIDILCNDMISSQRDFIQKLNTLSFTANFYEAILGKTDLNDLLCQATRLIKCKIIPANVAFFLHHENGFKMCMFENEESITANGRRLESCFTSEVIENVYKSNKVCSLENLFDMGFQGGLGMLRQFSAATIPLWQSGSSIGFILVYRDCEKPLTSSELNEISTITSGLSQAIQSCESLAV